MKDLIYKHALKNAYDHEGKATAGAVINRILGENPEAKKDMASLGKQVNEIVKDINSKSLEEITEKLKEIWPESFEKRDEERRTSHHRS